MAKIKPAKKKKAPAPSFHQHELLIIAYYWHAACLGNIPAHIKAHPMWPGNNDTFDIRTLGPKGSSFAGRDRLWDAIDASYGLGVRS